RGGRPRLGNLAAGVERLGQREQDERLALLDAAELLEDGGRRTRPLERVRRAAGGQERAGVARQRARARGRHLARELERGERLLLGARQLAGPGVEERQVEAAAAGQPRVAG